VSSDPSKSKIYAFTVELGEEIAADAEAIAGFQPSMP
jgi:hypothetical protein